MRALRLLPLLLWAGCNSTVSIDLSGLEPLRAAGPSQLSPRGKAVISAAGGTRPYRFALEGEKAASGREATIDPVNGELRAGAIGRVTERITVTDAKGESQTVEVAITDALALDPTRVVVEPLGLADFDAVGGQPPYTFSLGGIALDRVDPQTGLFEAGARGGRTASVVVTDAVGAVASAEVQVTFTFVAGSRPFDVAALDVDRDGVPDVAVAANGAGVLPLLRGDGQGNFTRWQELSLQAFPRSIKALDVDGDGLEDLLVACGSPDVVLVLLQDPKSVGGFREVARRPVGKLPVDVDAVAAGPSRWVVVVPADTGKSLDLLTLSASPGQVTVSATRQLALSARATRVAVGDFLGDSNPDLAVALSRPVPTRGSVALFTGRGTDDFGATPAAEYEVGEGLISVGGGALGGGPKLDLAVTSSASNELGLLLDDPATGQHRLQRTPIPAGDGSQCAACERGGDAACGQGACVQLRPGAETKTCLLTCQLNDDCPNGMDCQPFAGGVKACAPNLNICPTTSMLATGSNPRSVHVIDLDGDGANEVTVTNIDDLEVFRRGPKGYARAYRAATGVDPWELDFADVNADGLSDVLVANRSGHSITSLVGLGTHFTRGPEYLVGPSPAYPVIAQLDRDEGGAQDLLMAVGDSYLTLLGDGRGRLTPYRRIPFRSPSVPFLGDHNRDGYLDFYAFAVVSRTLELVPWERNVGFTGGPRASTGTQPLSLAVGDVNGDGRADMVVANNLDRNYSLHWGADAGTVSGYASEAIVHRYADPAIFAWYTLAAVRDGGMDHVVTVGRGNGNSYLDALTLDGRGASRVAWSKAVTNASALEPVPLDCNRDGLQDFAVPYVDVPSNTFDGQVFKAGPGGVYEPGALLHAGQPLGDGGYTAAGANSLVAQDLDGDGHTDLLMSARISRELVVFRGRGECRFDTLGRVSTGSALGSGLAVGDLDGDGLPDVAAPLPPDRLVTYFNLGGRSGELKSFARAGGLCEPCEDDGDCGGRADRCAGTLGRRKLCTRDCSGGRACPSGFECRDVGEGSLQCVHAGTQCVR